MPTSNTWATILSQVVYKGEVEVNAKEFDDRFLNLMAVLDLSDEVQDLAFRGWLKLTDHQQPSKLPGPTPEEFMALGTVAEKIERTQVQ